MFILHLTTVSPLFSPDIPPGSPSLCLPIHSTSIFPQKRAGLKQISTKMTYQVAIRLITSPFIKAEEGKLVWGLVSQKTSAHNVSRLNYTTVINMERIMARVSGWTSHRLVTPSISAQPLPWNTLQKFQEVGRSLYARVGVLVLSLEVLPDQMANSGHISTIVMSLWWIHPCRFLGVIFAPSF